MNRILLILILVFASFSVFSQGFITAKNVKVDLSGFVRNDFIYDSRRNVDACDQLIDLFPKRPEYDANGIDINDQSSAKFINTFTRFGTRFTGLEMGKAKVSALVEIDFTAGSMIPALRLRHAYTLFTWPKTKLLFGRTWHPTFTEKVYPQMLNENTGLPFSVFNRSPQLRVTHQLRSDLDVIAAAVYQFEYNNYGPDGKSYKYQRDAVIPNLHGQIQYYNANWVAGAGVDWKLIQPRTVTSGTNGKYATHEKLSTFAALAYIKYSKEKLMVQAKSMFGQNLSESLMPGGYVVTSVDAATGAETYAPLNYWYHWANFTYGTTWKVGLFAGYLQNMGATESPVGEFYAFAPEVKFMTKISPMLIYTYKDFMIGAEIGWTTAAYGEIDRADFGKVKNTENITNFRNMLSVAYNF